MSIHRPKRASSSRRDAGDSPKSPANAPPKWEDAVSGKPDSDFVSYAPSLPLSRNALVNHEKFGKGVVVEIDGNKAHILFQDGIRKLMHAG